MRRVFTERFGKYQAGHVIDQPLRWWQQWFPDFEDYTALDEPSGVMKSNVQQALEDEAKTEDAMARYREIKATEQEAAPKSRKSRKK